MSASGCGQAALPTEAWAVHIHEVTGRRIVGSFSGALAELPDYGTREDGTGLGLVGGEFRVRRRLN